MTQIKESKEIKQLSNTCIFIININQNNKLQCSIFNEENGEFIFQITPGIDEYEPCITFHMNNIIICHPEDENTIHFMKDWTEKANDFIEYQFIYQGKQYTVLSEVLFALIINEFKKKVEKDYIITKTEVNVSSRDCNLIQRMKTSLKSLGLSKVKINYLYYEYNDQGEILQEILEKQEEVNKYHSLLSNKWMKKLTPERKEMLSVDKSQLLEEENFYKMLLPFSTKERTEMKMYSLDNYCVFLASKWFRTIEDHINLVFVSKRFRYNMEKFHFNPLPLTNETRGYFPFLQTLWIYTSQDNLFENDNKIIARKVLPEFMYNLSQAQVKQLSEWTGLQPKEVFFDSKFDAWSTTHSTFLSKIIKKEKLVFLIEDFTGEKFGYFLSTKMFDQCNSDWVQTSKKSFEFNLKSNGRFDKFMKFEIINPWEGGYTLSNQTDGLLIWIGDIILYKKEKRKCSSCLQTNDYFNYHGVEHALCGKIDFIPKRIVVFEMS